MHIAFYAPLKSPDHPVPSGDRAMARLLMQALRLAGHRVSLVSQMRVFLREPVGLDQAMALADEEWARIVATWDAPDLFLCYHPYYKSPDLLGPVLCRDYDLPYVTIEASWSQRRNQGDWARTQELVAAGVRQAALNISMTGRDALGLQALGVCAMRLPPFIDTAPFGAKAMPEPGHFVTAAMMRPGDKLSSYAALAAALRRVSGNWRLSIAGDGPARDQVQALFADMGNVRFLGQLAQPELAALYRSGWAYLWPGHAEAYGLAALEAQAAGLPVISEATAGVPEVVQDGITGLLTPERDVDAYAQAITRMLTDADMRDRLAGAARRFVQGERDLAAAAARLDGLLRGVR
ncbi:glycosyltransferase family 4 protein [Paracoccus laeviglucosivorans]|uniref:Glycosyltransferase involved in cell wall bisynthesis n=1 Tax=Paracoccus laeviglucosivorans TaxID=1197861 RepID=A0A521D2M7_9RHOB|nr:glycosyltransferase family 4 protein [Paracoccus laeviglucosivorans]SMO65966.1 Glycosyltransferase involved in cell wall bisynthesis [Paracoccus laeviglucosivorans]